MFSTYRLMYSRRNRGLVDKSLCEIVREYQCITDKKLRSSYFATIFCNVFSGIYELQQKYPDITTERKVEEAIHTLQACLANYKPSNKVKFFTYFRTALRNKYITVTTHEYCNNRRVWKELEDMSLPHVVNAFNSVADKSYALNRIDLLSSISDMSLFNPVEIQYLTCLFRGITKPLELSNYLSLGKSLNLSENAIKMKIRNIRKSVKEKVSKNITSFI